MKPDVDKVTGVPFCSTDCCDDYDGKRCKRIGLRPSRICEPAVEELVSIVRGYEARARLLRDERSDADELPVKR